MLGFSLLRSNYTSARNALNEYSVIAFRTTINNTDITNSSDTQRTNLITSMAANEMSKPRIVCNTVGCCFAFAYFLLLCASSFFLLSSVCLVGRVKPQKCISTRAMWYFNSLFLVFTVDIHRKVRLLFLFYFLPIPHRINHTNVVQSLHSMWMGMNIYLMKKTHTLSHSTCRCRVRNVSDEEKELEFNELAARCLKFCWIEQYQPKITCTLPFHRFEKTSIY